MTVPNTVLGWRRLLTSLGWEVTATSKHYQAVSPRGTVITLSRGKMSPRAVAQARVTLRKDGNGTIVGQHRD
jgi:hypothetical protein